MPNPFEGTSAATPLPNPIPAAPTTPPTPLTSSSIPLYDPKTGPVVEVGKWTEEMLSTFLLTENLLKIQRDPAGFQRAREERHQTPTYAVMVNDYNGQTMPLSPATLCLPEDAEEARQHLVGLGMDPGIEVKEISLGSHKIRYNFDSRRWLLLGSLCAAGIVIRYAKTPVEIADRLTLDELKAAGMLRVVK